VETKRTTFPSHTLPYLLVAPQLIITLVFFIWPTWQAVQSSFLREDPFGLASTFVGVLHYQRLFQDPLYLDAIGRTAFFGVAVTVLSMGTGLLLAVAVNRLVRTAHAYSTLLLWPYAVAPVVAGILWWFMFNSSTGILPYMLSFFGVDWNHKLNGTQAMILVIIAASWKQVSYNFLFFLAGLQSVPQSLTEAAAIDGAGPVKRFFTIVLPLLSPTTFFLYIVNVNYTMFGLNLGSSSAQSVVLMLFVIALTFIQFRYVERRVQY
jgi:sn-glycerol 3-phosphate transport system permease protein